jgi:hypothetical protein
MEGYNKYNFDVFADRLWGNVHDVVKITNMFRHTFNIETLNLYGLGDHVAGDIHEELTRTNQHPTTVSVLMVASLYAQALAIFAREFKKIRVATVVGNHGRKTKKRPFQ